MYFCQICQWQVNNRYFKDSQWRSGEVIRLAEWLSASEINKECWTEARLILVLNETEYDINYLTIDTSVLHILVSKSQKIFQTR